MRERRLEAHRLGGAGRGRLGRLAGELQQPRQVGLVAGALLPRARVVLQVVVAVGEAQAAGVEVTHHLRRVGAVLGAGEPEPQLAAGRGGEPAQERRSLAAASRARRWRPGPGRAVPPRRAPRPPRPCRPRSSRPPGPRPARAPRPARSRRPAAGPTGTAGSPGPSSGRRSSATGRPGWGSPSSSRRRRTGRSPRRGRRRGPWPPRRGRACRAGRRAGALRLEPPAAPRRNRRRGRGPRRARRGHQKRDWAHARVLARRPGRVK